MELFSSEALEDAVRRNPSTERQWESQATLSLAITSIRIDRTIVLRAQNLVGLGYGPFDALHVAAAESACSDAL